MQLRDLADDLVERGVDEAVELDLHDGPVAAEGEADRGAHDAGLGERRVDHALRAELVEQSVGDAEDTAELADVLPHDENLGVIGHRTAQALVDGLRHRQRASSRFTPGGGIRESFEVGGELARAARPGPTCGSA